MELGLSEQGALHVIVSTTQPLTIPGKAMKHFGLPRGQYVFLFTRFHKLEASSRPCEGGADLDRVEFEMVAADFASGHEISHWSGGAAGCISSL